MRAGNPLLRLAEAGVSVWSDYIRRGWILDGDLRRLISSDGLKGLTSNPTIFEKAISGSADYDLSLEPLALADKPVLEIFETLAVEDIQMAADLFRPVYEKTRGVDGYVSLEVHPQLARDTRETIATARRLWTLAGRPNVMIKVPGTKEGLEAIETLIGEGLNINVTLLFSRERYREVQEAYLRGLERLEKAGKPLSSVASVASFFVSRVDTAVDKLLQEKSAASADAREKKILKGLSGMAAIANCKLTYQDFLEAFGGDRFQRLKAKGARPQRLLWASTSTKNPAYRDVVYVEELIGHPTVNTMPLATIDGFRDHGRVRPTLEAGVAEARELLQRLEAAGIPMKDVTRRLEEEGVASFTASYDSLLKAIAAKKEAIRASSKGRPAWRDAFDTALAELNKARFVRRLWDHDPTLWSQDPRHQKIILNRLGWLHSPEWAQERVHELEAFVAGARKAGFKKAVLLGMGGSSLAPEVYRKVFGAAKGFLDLKVLDSTDPRAVRAVEKSVDLKTTLFIVSSKSGGTIEVRSLYQHFRAKLDKLRKDKAGSHFVAITDPGTVLGALAAQSGFQKVFVNPPDIGGRYSALSYFGLVPAALIGVDLRALLERGRRMADRCAACVPAQENAGVRVGAGLAVLGRDGKDKVTFVLSRQIRPFGDWVEQLIAESTGKEGKELLPVVGEEAGDPASYGADRTFVFLALEGDKALQKRAAELERAGQAVIFYFLKDAFDLGAEFFRWEVATVVAGAMLAIDAFDEPNVQESKDNTAELLKRFEADGRLPEEPHTLDVSGVKVFGDPQPTPGDTLPAVLARHLKRWTPGDYLGLLAYTARTPESDRELGLMRETLREAFKAAITVGYGPRFLHSTGQLHKGGKNNGVFLQVTVRDPEELAIPGSPFGFSTLKQAQAMGDLHALRSKGRRVLRVHLADPAKGMKALRQALEQAVKSVVHA